MAINGQSAFNLLPIHILQCKKLDSHLIESDSVYSSRKSLAAPQYFHMGNNPFYLVGTYSGPYIWAYTLAFCLDFFLGPQILYWVRKCFPQSSHFLRLRRPRVNLSRATPKLRSSFLLVTYFRICNKVPTNFRQRSSLEPLRWALNPEFNAHNSANFIGFNISKVRT